MSHFLASDGMLVLFSLVLGLLVGVFGERARQERAAQQRSGEIMKRRD